MPNTLRDLHEVTVDDENDLIFEKNISIPLRNSDLPIRANVYRPKDETVKYPVLVTYGPYGKDIPYDNFFAKSFAEVNPAHKSKYSCWETPDPVFWTKQKYIVLRADERGLGQSPGIMDTMSKGTSECFFDVVEWAAVQPWSSGKVGLLGISYYAGSQWRVAARRPKGLAAIIPWEGMSDYYRDRCRHGGILSNSFIKFWWNRQVITNQYGRPGRAASKWGEDTIEGDLSEEERLANRSDQTIDNEENSFRDDEYYASKEFQLEDIEVPLLSVANWGGILLHLRGNVEGYNWAGSKNKFIRFITGRHDLPFYYDEEVKVQKSFLDAFLHGNDSEGWTELGKVAPVSVILRKGNVGFNDAKAEAVYTRREESEWPIARTAYTKYFLHSEKTLAATSTAPLGEATIDYKALGSLEDPELVQFITAPFEEETEITGNILAHINISGRSSTTPAPENYDIDVFLTLRILDASGKEIYYTGTAGDPIPLTKGWLRLSLRKVNETGSRNRKYLPQRDYLSTDVQKVVPGEVYAVDIEVVPTNVVVQPGERIVFELSSGDTQGCGIFGHSSKKDRSEEKFAGVNTIHFGPGVENYVVLPVVPAKEQAAGLFDGLKKVVGIDTDLA